MSVDGMPTLSNETMYQKNWSSFVDDAISKHQRRERGGCADGEGSFGAGRFELRDVMCLEEVLAKLEHAEGGWIDYERRQPNAELYGGDYVESERNSLGPTSGNLLGSQNRQPLHDTPGLPPMFENPRPSFFALMYNERSSSQTDGQGRPPPPLSLDSQRADQRIALKPERDLLASPGTIEGQHVSPRGGSLDGGGSGANKSALVPFSEPENKEGQTCGEEPNTTAFEPRGGNNNSRAVSVSKEKDRDCSASLSAEQDAAYPIGLESLPKFMESLCLDESTAPPPVECTLPESSRHGGVESLAPGGNKGKRKSEPGQRTLSGDDCGNTVQAATAVVASNDDPLHVAAAEEQTRICRKRGGDEQGRTDRFLEPEEERLGAQRVSSSSGTPPQPEPFQEDVLLSQLSARLNGTHISDAGDGDRSGGLVAGLDERLPGNGLLSPGQLDFESAANSSSGGSGQARSDGVPAPSHDSSVHDQNITIGSGPTSSSPAAFRISGGGTTNIGYIQQEVGSADPGTCSSSSEARLEPVSPEGLRRESRDDKDDNARAHSEAESPEMLRLGSASQDSDGIRHRVQLFDRGSWEAGSAAGRLAGGDVRCSNDNNDDGIFSLEQSPERAPSASERDSQAFGSMLSPAIGSFGGMDGDGGGVDLLSPLALARSLDESGQAHGDDDDDDNSCCRGARPAEDRGDYGGSTPEVSARPERSVDSDGGPPPSPKPQRTLFAEEAEDFEDGDEDITLTPEVSRLSESGVASFPSRFVTFADLRKQQGEEGDCDWWNLETGASMDGVEGDGSGLMLPPPPRQPSLTPQRKEQQQQQQQQQQTQRRHPENPESRRLSSNTRRGRTAFADRTNTPAERHGERSRDAGSVTKHAIPIKCGAGGGELVEQVSIGSFSESETGGSRLESNIIGGCEGRDVENAFDSSLVDSSPRRPRAIPREDLGGFYPPLQVANIARKEPQDEESSLSTLQRSTLKWMLWRESSEEGQGEGREGGRSVAAAVSFSSDDTETLGVHLKGGVLGHLSSEEAWRCVRALLHEKSVLDGGVGEKADSKRAPPAHPVTGLPCGATLIVAPTKEAAWEWTNRLESGAGSLSVLSYVMPLRERRRLSAKQAAAFDVVVTTYDVLKAKEVPRGVERKQATSPRIWALPGSKQWRTRNTKEKSGKKPAAPKTDHMVSLLHGVWWERVVADGAQLLGNQRSARAVAAFALVGTARWCVVERESMAMIENTSERMRCLTAFLRIPAEVAMVEAAEKLFYHSRPIHVAPLHPRGSGAGGDNSLSLSEGDAGQSSPGASHRKRRPPSRRGASGVGKPALRAAGGSSATRKVGGGAGERERGGKGRRGSSRVGAGSSENREDERYGEGAGGRAAAGGEALSRGDVEYKATTLRLRRARG